VSYILLLSNTRVITNFELVRLNIRYEGLMLLLLFCQPIFFILVILVAKRAFRDYETIEKFLDLVLSDREIYPL
jgi:hypothetical protein